MTAKSSEGFTCPRCGSTSRADAPSDDAAALHEIADLGVDLGSEKLFGSKGRAASNPFDFGHEDLVAELERAARLLKRPPIWTSGEQVSGDRAATPSPSAGSGRSWGEQPGPASTVLPPADSPGARPTAPLNPPRRISAPFAWLLVALGQGALSCGVALLVWSHFLARPDLWQLGWAIAPGGLFAMVIGLLFRLERVWTYQRATCERVIEMDRELRELEQTTRLLSTQASQRAASPSQAFYTHLAHGAAPHILVSDLQGQLDLLAQRLAAERK